MSILGLKSGELTKFDSKEHVRKQQTGGLDELNEFLNQVGAEPVSVEEFIADRENILAAANAVGYSADNKSLSQLNASLISSGEDYVTQDEIDQLNYDQLKTIREYAQEQGVQDFSKIKSKTATDELVNKYGSVTKRVGHEARDFADRFTFGLSEKVLQPSSAITTPPQSRTTFAVKEEDSEEIKQMKNKQYEDFVDMQTEMKQKDTKQLRQQDIEQRQMQEEIRPGISRIANPITADIAQYGSGLGILGKAGKAGMAAKQAIQKSPYLTAGATEATQTASRGGDLTDTAISAATPLAFGGVIKAPGAIRSTADKLSTNYGVRSVQQGSKRVYGKALESTKNAIASAQKIKDPAELTRKASAAINNTVKKSGIQITDKIDAQIDKLKVYKNNIEDQMDNIVNQHSDLPLTDIRNLYGSVDAGGRTLTRGTIDDIVDNLTPPGVALPDGIKATISRLKNLQKELSYRTRDDLTPTNNLKAYKRNRQIIQKQITNAKDAREPQSIELLKNLYDGNNEIMYTALEEAGNKQAATAFRQASQEMSDALYTDAALDYVQKLNPDWLSTITSPARNITYMFALVSTLLPLPNSTAAAIVASDIAARSRTAQRITFSAAPAIIAKVIPSSKEAANIVKSVLGKKEFKQIQKLIQQNPDGSSLVQYMIPKMFSSDANSEKYRETVLKLADNLHDQLPEEYSEEIKATE